MNPNNNQGPPPVVPIPQNPAPGFFNDGGVVQATMLGPGCSDRLLTMQAIDSTKESYDLTSPTELSKPWFTRG
ncbi:hypothetical protein Tco_0987295 [Tanacetum coccineum]